MESLRDWTGEPETDVAEFGGLTGLAAGGGADGGSTASWLPQCLEDCYGEFDSPPDVLLYLADGGYGPPTIDSRECFVGAFAGALYATQYAGGRGLDDLQALSHRVQGRWLEWASGADVGGSPGERLAKVLQPWLLVDGLSYHTFWTNAGIDPTRADNVAFVAGFATGAVAQWYDEE